MTVRLACIKHAASVYPEPGSNSPTNFILFVRVLEPSFRYSVVKVLLRQSWTLNNNITPTSPCQHCQRVFLVNPDPPLSPLFLAQIILLVEDETLSPCIPLPLLKGEGGMKKKRGAASLKLSTSLCRLKQLTIKFVIPLLYHLAVNFPPQLSLMLY